jgi:hypothetical protein
MALSRVKTWNAAETLTASDLNAEFNNICNHFGSLDNDDINSTATFTMGELIVGSGITSADGGQLHVHTASAGTIQAVADADEAVFENSAASGITILSGTSSTGMIAFGDSGDADIGKISYSHSTNGYTITANAATALQISSAGAVTTGGNVLSDTDSTDDLGSTSVRWANVYTDAIGDSGQALGVKATTLSFDAASTIDTSGNNALTLDAGSAVLTLDGGTLESDASTLSFDAAATIDTSGNNALTLDAGSAVLTLDGGTLESDASTLSFDAAATIDTSGNNALSLDAGSAVLTLDGGTIESDASTFSFDAAATIDTSGNNNLTLSAGTGTIVATAGDVTIFDDNNNADTSLSIGTSATEALVVQALNGGSNKTLEELRFTTKTASATGDHGKMSFYIDEAEIATIDDGGIDLASGKSFTVAGSAVGGAALTGSTDNTVVTVSGADAIQGEANLTFDGTTLALADGRTLLVGGTSAVTTSVTATSQILGTTSADTSLMIGRWSADNDHGHIYFAKSRNATVGSSTVVQDNDHLGAVHFMADDGTDFNSESATIRAQVDGTPGSNDVPGRLVFSTTADGASSPTERMRIDSSGDVMIGSTNTGPSDGSTVTTLRVANFGSHGDLGSLELAGQQASGTSSGVFGNIDFLGYASDGGTLNTRAIIRAVTESEYRNSELTFWTQPTAGSITERMRINSSGEVGIGTSPSYPLHVVGNDSVWLSELKQTHTTPNGVTMWFSAADPDNNTQKFLSCTAQSTVRASIYSDGDVWTSDAGTLTSDERLKTNIVDASDKLADVMRLKVRNYEWTPEYHPAKVGEKKIGFIAQELEEVFPSLITEHDIAADNSVEEQLYTAEDDTQYYIDGDEIPDGKAVGDVKAESQIPDGKSIGDVKVEAKAHEPKMRKSYKNAFTPILVKALQEVTERLEAAEAKIAALEAA